MTKMSSRELHLDMELVKKAIASGPVLVDEEDSSCVLLRFDDYKKQEQSPVNAERKPFRSLLEAISMPGTDDIEFAPTRSRELPRDVDLS